MAALVNFPFLNCPDEAEAAAEYQLDLERQFESKHLLLQQAPAKSAAAAAGKGCKIYNVNVMH